MRALLPCFCLAFLAIACHPRDDGATSVSADTNGGTSLTEPAAVDVAIGAAFSDQTAPASASDGVDYLVAWSDAHRSQATATRATILVAKVGELGAVASGANVALPSSADGDDVEPAIASNGSGYLVVWTHAVRKLFLQAPDSSYVEALHVDADGKALDKAPIILGKNDKMQARSPAVAWNGTGYLVTWSDNRNAASKNLSEIYTSFIGPNGAGPEQRLTNADNLQWKHSAVAAAGGHFLVAWDQGDPDPQVMSQILAQRLDEKGAPIDPSPTTITDESYQATAPRIASDGADFFLTWSVNFEGSATTPIDGRPIPGSGAIPSSGAIHVTPDGPSAGIAWDGEAYAIAWRLGATRVAKDGSPMPAKLDGASSTIEHVPAVASNGTSLLVFRTLASDPLSDIFTSSRVGATLFPKAGGDPLKTSIFPARSAATQRDVAGAFGGDRFLAVWEEGRGDDRDRHEVWAAFFDGAVKAGKPFRVRGDGQKPTKPTVAFDGTDFVVAWQEMSSDNTLMIASTKVGSDGSVADVTSINGTDPLLVRGDGHTLVLASGDRGFFLDQPIDQSKPNLQRDEEPGLIGSIAAATWDGQRYVIAWIPDESFDGPNGTHIVVKVQSFDRTGHALGAATQLATLPSAFDLPHLSAAGDGAGTTLVAWDDTTSAGGVWGVRVKNGAGVDAKPIRLDAAKAPLLASAPNVAWNGLAWSVAYETCADRRVDDACALALTRVRSTPTGLERLGDGIDLALAGARPFVASGPSGKAFLAFESVAMTDAAPNRIAVRLFTDVAEPAIPTPPASTLPAPVPTQTPPATGDDDDAPAPPVKATPAEAPAAPAPASEPTPAATKSSTITVGDGCNAGGGAAGSPWLLLVALVVMRAVGRRPRSGSPHRRSRETRSPACTRTPCPHTR
jgi:hypothetical protein